MTADTLFADRYRLERRLGVGGMASVQLAMDTRLERRVAVKLLAEHLAQDSNFVSRFRREALAAARLVHPNVVQVFDFGADDDSGRPFIVMEWVDGPSCAEILRELGRLAPEDAVSILTQACRGLDYAHRNGVIHRDVKPGNLLRARDGGQVKLADFGIAKATEHSDMTKVGSVLGTAAYLSPEQARGEQAGPASDLYALGVVSYQLLGGRLPYEAASLTDLARQQDSAAPPLLHEVDPEIPRALSLVVARALERRPADRFADAAELERALEGSLRGIVPPEPTAATQVADDTEATRVLDRTAVTTPLARTKAAPPRRRRMEPIADAPAPPRRPQPARAPKGAAAPAVRRRPGRGLRLLRTLLILAVLTGVAVGAYVVTSEGGQRGVQLKEQIEGDVNQAVQEIQQLIDDNTR
jgi:eukaryotic-like serine/threonine-protein kinase